MNNKETKNRQRHSY